MTRANGEILVTLEALHRALQLDAGISITGQATGPEDVQRGLIRLLVIDPTKNELREGELGRVIMFFKGDL